MSKKAFVIGMNTLGLKYCVNDAMLISNGLKHHGYDVITVKLSDEKTRILKRFEELIENCAKTDTLIFYFSGHGLLRKGKLDLVLADDTSTRSNKLPISAITDAFEECVALHKMIILDCCHSGASHADWSPGSSDIYRILTASERLEKTKELDNLEASFLTYRIHQALTTPPVELLDDDHKIRINSLHQWLVTEAESHNGPGNSIKVPIPNLLDNAKANIEIATVTEEHKSKVDKTSKITAQLLLEEEAECRYRELILESCDIIDLANLPESDRHIATRQLELRRLYVPLRVKVEICADDEVDELELEAIETRRQKLLWSRTEYGEPKGRDRRSPVGKRLAEARRLVILGDPGAGKTTMTRWIATAYLLRLKGDAEWQDLPDVATLPDETWLPIIVRCRDLDPAHLKGSLDDILHHTLRKSEMTDAESQALRNILRAKLTAGQALLLIDGLDEIADPAVRVRFCRQIEQMQIAYPDAPMIITSRIVGYREMGYRIKRGFEHLTVAELSKEEKDVFVRRWCAVTESPERRTTATSELIRDIHSTDRIERLTGNPMLLTTVALVKRKVGKLPSRRADLYWEAVQVLLNWRSEVDKPIDHREAVPQLEYLSYAMCDRGVQQLREDEILALFTQMRQEYPNIHAVQNHTPDEFLRVLERRTGILIEAGHVRHLGRPTSVFEFRHLTFQEYLAGIALVDGRFPNRDRSRGLADYVAPLAGRTSEVDSQPSQKELAVTEDWREALRLCVASCDDDNVDDVLKAILAPLPTEDATRTARPRAILAAICLADEPNVSKETAETILQAFVRQINIYDGRGKMTTSLDATAKELATSRWANVLRSYLIEEFCKRKAVVRFSAGALCEWFFEVSFKPEDEDKLFEWLVDKANQCTSVEDHSRVAAALEVYFLESHIPEYRIVPELVNSLLGMLTGRPHVCHAAALALYKLHNEGDGWQPSSTELERLIAVIENPVSDNVAVGILCLILRFESYPRVVEALITSLYAQDSGVTSNIIDALGQIGDVQAIEPLIAKLDDLEGDVRSEAATALGQIGDAQAVEPLIATLDDPEGDVRNAAATALGQIGDVQAVEPLIAKLDDSEGDVRNAATTALGQIDDPRAIEPLIAMLHDHYGLVRHVATMALRQIGEVTVEPLIAKLNDLK